MNRLGLKACITAGTLLVTAMVGAWFWQSPIWAVEALSQTSASDDMVELAQLIDMPALREQLRAKLRRDIGGHDADGDIGAAIAVSALGSWIDARITPSAIINLVKTGRYAEHMEGSTAHFANWDISDRGLNGFRARLRGAPAAEPVELVFHRDGLGWRLVGLIGVRELSSQTKAEEDGLADLVVDFPASRQDRRSLPSGMEYFGASGTVANVGRGTRSVPDILIVFRDERSNAVFQHAITPPRRSLGPGESVSINEAVTDVPPSAVVAEFGWVPHDGAKLVVKSAVDIRVGLEPARGAARPQASATFGGDAELEARRLAEQAAAEASAAAIEAESGAYRANGGL